MSVQSVGPFSNFKTNFNTTKQTATDPQAVQDVAKDVSKNNKKTAAIIGGVAALAILGTGALVAIKRHKVPNEIKTALNNFEETNKAANALAQSAKKQADEVTEYAQRLFNEVSDLFKKGDEITPDGAVLRKIIGDGDDTYKLMQEFSEDGALVRESIFIDGALGSIEEGIEELSDGSKKIARSFGFFKDGTLIDYQEGIETFADLLSGKVAKTIRFKEGKLRLYQEGIETSAGLLSGKVAKTISFEEGKLSLYQEGTETFADSSGKIARIIGFEEGGIPRQYAKGAEYDPFGGLREVAKGFELTDKGWREVSK